MDKMKKNIISISLVAVTVLTLAFSFYYYTANNPQLFVILKADSISQDLKFTHMNFAYATALNIPLSDKLNNNLNEIHMWNDDVIVEIMNINSHNLDVNCSYNETSSQTIVTYQGSYVDENGENIQYFNEKAFDFLLPITENQLIN